MMTGRNTVAVLAGCIVLLAASAQAADVVGARVKLFTLKALNADSYQGRPYVSLGDYFGTDAKEPKKAVLLSFFATYCEPCKREMPFLAALQESYADQGLQVLIVSIDKEADKIAEVKKRAEDANIKFPVLSDRFNLVARRYLVDSLPNVYIVDSTGTVVFTKVGYDEDVSVELHSVVRKNLGVAASDPVPPALIAFVRGAEQPPAIPVSSPGPAGAQANSGEPTAAEATVAGVIKSSDKKKKKRRKRRAKKRRRRR